MAKFEVAYAKTNGNEGGYVNHQNDTGGETYKGVARNYHPHWQGWAIVDDVKRKIGFDNTKRKVKELDDALASIDQVQQLVHSFYRQGFWDSVNGDAITDQNVANNIYDFAVNSGVDRAARYAQAIVGTEQDGAIGPKTIASINAYRPEIFVAQYKDSRLAFVRRVVAKDPTQEVFLDGWESRIRRV